jgi:hypothetical protein
MFRKLRLGRYHIYLLAQMLVILMVIMLFRTMADKKVASLIASLLFLGISLGCFFIEYKKARFKSKLFWVTGLQFFLLFAVPIFSMRLLYWTQEFADIAVLGVGAASLHRFSSMSYALWMAGCLIQSFQKKKGV